MADEPAPSSTAVPYNSPELDAIRKRIDELDDRIHDTLMERADLVSKVGEEKRKNNIQIVQPAREARMIRRLLGRHKGALPAQAVIRIWRELVGAVSLLQTGLKVVVSCNPNDPDLWDCARDYFGSCLPITKAASAVTAISSVRDGKATFAVVPRPDIEEDQPWWTNLAINATERMNIIIALPYDGKLEAKGVETRGLVISKSGFDNSGDDNSFLLIQCSPDVSRARLVDSANKAGLTPLGLSSKRTTGAFGPSLHFMEVRGYVANEDVKMSEFQVSLGDGAHVTCAGGYPVPPSMEDLVKTEAAVEAA